MDHIKLQEENINEFLCNIKLGKDFLGHKKQYPHKEKIIGLHQNKKILFIRGYNWENE